MHDILTIRPDLKVSFLYTHHGDCCQKVGTVVGLLTPRQVKVRSCTVGPRNNAAVNLSFTFNSRVCKHISRLRLPSRPFHGERPPTTGLANACGLHLQVLLHKRGTSVSLLWGNQTIFSVSRRNRREAREGCFSDLAENLCCSMLGWWLSCQDLLWILCHSKITTSVSCPAPFCKPHALFDFM